MSLATYRSQRFADQIFNLRNVLDFRKGLLQFVQKISQTKSSAVQFRLGHETVYLLKDPDDIKAVLVQRKNDFDKSTPGFDGLRAYLGQGLLSSNTHSWSLHRKLAQPFFQPKKVQEYFQLFRSQSKSKISQMTAGPEHEYKDLNLWMASITLAILGDTLLSYDMDEESGKLASSINCIFVMTAKRIYNPFSLPLWIPTKSHCIFANAQTAIKEVIFQLLDKQRKQKIQKLSYVKQLMDYRDDQGSPLQSKKIFDEIITMIQAGHETSSNAIIWTMVHLHENPEAYMAVKIEALSLPEDYQFSDLEKLPNLEACIYESMRLDPPAWAFDRRALKDVQLKNCKIKKGQIALLAPAITHRLPDYWEKPDHFHLKHFLGKKAHDNPAYFPFGLGPRMCIGQHFAMVEIKTILIEIFRNTDYTIFSSEHIQREGSVTLRPASPVLARFKTCQ